MANEAITVEELARYCNELVQKGQGEKKILISSDDEGNGYHELFFGFSKSEVLFKSGCALLPFGIDGEMATKEYVVLG